MVTYTLIVANILLILKPNESYILNGH